MSELNKVTASVTGWNWFVPLLTLLFIYLKLTNQITWSWWWVLSPIWISLILATIIVFIILIIYSIIKRNNNKKEYKSMLDNIINKKD